MIVSWPPDYVAEYARRQRLLNKLRSNPSYVVAAKAYYSTRPHDFVENWGITYDPRNAGTSLPTYMPFLMFQRQYEFIDFVLACLKGETDGLIEKSRDLGATWLAVALSVWLWTYLPGAAIGWGSRKEQLVDKLGDPDSIFEKHRIFLKYIPRELRPVGYDPFSHQTFMKIVNPENGATITGESGDNIGRGGRKLIYWKDESAHYEHPESIEGALGDNTRVQMDISSVHGLGTVFQRKREAGIEWAPGQEIVKGRTNVFIMDWRDHPGKTQAWYDQRKAKYAADGLAHVFAQETDRDYAASVEGVIIPSDWVSAAIDAHVKLDYLGDWDSGLWGAALDVADEGLDRNALAIRKGSILRGMSEWGERDTGLTTRRMVDAVRDFCPIEVQYDCIGVGSGVKAEANRLIDDKVMPKGLNLVPWNAGRDVLHPHSMVIERVNDEDSAQGSPKNKDFYTNLKAQAWWELRRRFEKTYRAVQDGEYFPVEELISLPSDLPLVRSVQRELSQPTAGLGSRLKLLINKKPDGAKSPNLADAIVMAYWPLPKMSTGEAVFGSYGYTAGSGG